MSEDIPHREGSLGNPAPQAEGVAVSSGLTGRAEPAQRRRRRLVGVGAVCVLVIVGVVGAVTLRHKASSTPVPASMARTVTAATTTTPLDAYVAKQAAAAAIAAARAGQSGSVVSVHSVPVEDSGAIVAVAAFSYSATERPVEVLSYAMGHWSVVAALGTNLNPPAQPLGNAHLLALAPGSPVSVADVTGDGHPDFLVIVEAADNQPGAVVSRDGGSWRYVPNSGPFPTSDTVARSPQFQGGSSSPHSTTAPRIAHSGTASPSLGPTTARRVTSGRPTLPDGLRLRGQ